MTVFEEDISELLKYLPSYGIIICRKCRYAIQPHALDHHLLRHSIYRSDRQQLLDRLSGLTLLDPQFIPTPATDSLPFPDLPAHNGHKCLWSDCPHACVSQKRMEQHWSRSHGEQNAKKVRSRPAVLQTFFKGNKVRYFEVAAKGTTGTSSPSASVEHTNFDIVENVVPSLNLQDLAYFHHYRNSPCLIPQRSMAESHQFWEIELFELAFEFEFLMLGILGASAAHLASEALSVDACEKHYVAAIKYQAAGMPLFQKTLKQPDSRNSVALLVYTRFIGLQRIVLQRVEQDKLRSSVVCQRMLGLETVLETFILYRGTEVVLQDLQHWLPPESGFVSTEQSVDSLHLSEIEDKLTSPSYIPVSLSDSPYLGTQISSVLETLSEGMSNSTPTEMQAIEQGAAALLSAISHSFSQDSRTRDRTGAVWNGMAEFALSVSEDFVTMLKAHHSAALVLLAYWCALWGELEEHYVLLRGHSARLLRMIEVALPHVFAPLVPQIGRIGHSLRKNHVP